MVWKKETSWDRLRSSPACLEWPPKLSKRWGFTPIVLPREFLQHSRVAGVVGFTVILIVFFYYFAVLLLVGAEINAFFAEGVRPISNDLATFVSTMAGQLNQDIPADEAQQHVDTKPTEAADKEHAVDYVTQTPEPEVPERVAQDPEVQEQVLKTQQRETDTGTAHQDHPNPSSST